MRHEVGALRDRFIALQREIVAALEAFDGDPFLTDAWSRPPGDPLQGDCITRLIELPRPRRCPSPLSRGPPSGASRTTV